jgi:hypothetical protein
VSIPRKTIVTKNTKTQTLLHGNIAKALGNILKLSSGPERDN